MRYLTILFALLFTFAPQVEAVSGEQSALCDGRYAHAESLLNQTYGKYGSLYSGGSHFVEIDNVGGTVDLYRLWREKSDAQLRKADKINFSWYGGERNPLDVFRSSGDAWHVRALAAALSTAESDEAGELDESEIYLAASALDLGTSLASRADWWLHPELTEGLTPNQLQIAPMAQERPLLDWLHTVQSASAAPWAIAWYSYSGEVSAINREYKNLYSHAWTQFEKSGSLEWAVAASLLVEPNTHYGLNWKYTNMLAYRELAELRERLTQSATDCSATNAEYAAFAVLALEHARVSKGHEDVAIARLLPLELRRIVVRNSAMRWVASQGYRGSSLGSLAEVTEEKYLLAWLNVGRTYFADRIEEVITINSAAPLDAKTLRALNLLSVEDLVKFGRSSDRTKEDARVVLSAAYLRSFALKQNKVAELLLPELKSFLTEKPEIIDQIMSRNWPLDVRLALAALSLPEPSVWLAGNQEWSRVGRDTSIRLRINSKRGIDLPSEFRTAAFLQRDLETWLLAPQRWQEYRGMRGHSKPELQRASDRQAVHQGLFVQTPEFFAQGPYSNQGWPDANFNFVDLIAWDEITRLGPKTGLSRRISEVIIRWAEENSERWFAPDEDIAAALRQVIYLNKSNNTGERDGQPLGKIAFELLHTAYSDTEAAQSTPYWFNCHLSCER